MSKLRRFAKQAYWQSELTGRPFSDRTSSGEGPEVFDMRKVWWRASYEDAIIMGPYKYKNNRKSHLRTDCVGFLGSL